MKIRNGFVSNSSTSSFLIFGVCFDDEYLALEILDLSEDKNSLYDVVDKIEELITEQQLNLSVETCGEYSDSIYVGRSWSSVGNNETGWAFKATIERDIKKLFPKMNVVTVGTYEEAYHS